MSQARIALSAAEMPGESWLQERPLRRWRVLHACQAAGPSAALADAQCRAGMCPSVLTPQGWYGPGTAESEATTALSLVHEWQRVRRWRNLFAAEGVEDWAEVLHAHCFAAGMAALRGALPVVYDLAAAIGAGVMPKPGAWLLRSLRVAEQFALLRADAVVVHSHAMWDHAVKHGAHPEHLFVVPAPMELAESSAPPERAGIAVFAPDAAAGGREENARSLRVLMEAFALLASEVEKVRLLVEAGPEQAAEVVAAVRAAKLGEAVEITAPRRRAEALAAAHIVIAGRPAGEAPNPSVVQALAYGRALLAADVAENREVTPQGRGCLWFRGDDARDLAARAAFLARNRDFRAALSASGRQHVNDTCGPLAVARKYDEIYRHAFQHRRRGPQDPLRKLQVAQAHW